MSQPSCILDHMTWPEAAQALKTVKVALLATGSCEQHGPHLELRTDAVRAYDLARRLAERLYPEVLLCPAVPFGVSEHHMAFPGTLTLSPGTFAALVKDLLLSLYHHGLHKFFIVNAHGGNQAALQLVASELKARYPVHVAIAAITPTVADLVGDFTGGRLTGHSCEVEVSQVLAVAPELVRRDRLQPGQIKRRLLPHAGLGPGAGITMSFRFDELTANGALGDATLASEAFGRRLVEAAVDRMAEFLRALIDEPPAEPPPGRGD